MFSSKLSILCRVEAAIADGFEPGNDRHPVERLGPFAIGADLTQDRHADARQNIGRPVAAVGADIDEDRAGAR